MICRGSFRAPLPARRNRQQRVCALAVSEVRQQPVRLVADEVGDRFGPRRGVSGADALGDRPHGFP
jgi:hypothetical protein